jgi:hypothetical protein
MIVPLIGLGVAQVYCRFFGHVWRRPHKGESVPTDSRVCKRCTATRAVRKRKAP